MAETLEMVLEDAQSIVTLGTNSDILKNINTTKINVEILQLQPKFAIIKHFTDSL
ncbi:5865_t:CDS:2, partial [Dentiscutata erythropus]